MKWDGIASVAVATALVSSLAACGGGTDTARRPDPAVQRLRVANAQEALLYDEISTPGNYASARFAAIAATNDLLDALKGSAKRYRRSQIREALSTLRSASGFCPECVALLEQALQSGAMQGSPATTYVTTVKEKTYTVRCAPGKGGAGTTPGGGTYGSASTTCTITPPIPR